jgi:hypothetical protein
LREVQSRNIALRERKRMRHPKEKEQNKKAGDINRALRYINLSGKEQAKEIE